MFVVSRHNMVVIEERLHIRLSDIDGSAAGGYQSGTGTCTADWIGACANDGDGDASD